MDNDPLVPLVIHDQGSPASVWLHSKIQSSEALQNFSSRRISARSLARKNRKPTDNTDHFEILSWAEPKAVEDDVAPTKCKLIPYDKVPTVDS
jgi:hypothetical protein